MAGFYKGLAATVAALSLSCSGTLQIESRNSIHIRSQVPSVQEVRANYRLNVKEEDREEIESILDEVEKVPDPIQKTVNDFGGTVVIFDGLITDNESMKHLKGVQIPKWSKGKTYDVLPGVYSVNYKEILIQQNYTEDSHGSVSLELHEYGHSVDHALGSLLKLNDVSSSSYFIKIHEVSKTYKNSDGSLRISKYGLNYRDEFFAEDFAKFYSSHETRSELKIDFPEVYDFLIVLETKVADGSFADLKNLDDGSDKPDSVKDQEGDASQGHCVIHQYP